MKDIQKCMTCEKETDNYYTLKTNQGEVYKCVPCYETGYMRDQRNEYGSAYQNNDLSTKINKRF